MWWSYDYELIHPYSHKRCNLWAKDVIAAENLGKRLRFRFSGCYSGILPEFRPTRLMQYPGGVHRPDVLHAICFLTFIGVRAGIDLDRLTSDNSPAHTLAHSLAFGGVNDGLHTDNIIEQCIWLESVVPGMPPEDIDMDVIWDPDTDHPVSNEAVHKEWIARVRRTSPRFPAYNPYL